ncbi:MAG: DoxX family membrane protein [Acinetobacter sp.]|nr:MAG: DoxX family membrane protein [Acinetobacter sp.]
MKQKITFVLSLIFGLFFINAGLDKFFHYMPMPKDISPELMKAMGGMMAVSWLMPLIAVAEIAGGLLIILPKTRALGALIVFPVMVGIVLTNTVTDATGFPIAAVFAAVLLWIIYDNRAKYMPLVGE